MEQDNVRHEERIEFAMGRLQAALRFANSLPNREHLRNLEDAARAYRVARMEYFENANDYSLSRVVATWAHVTRILWKIEEIFGR